MHTCLITSGGGRDDGDDGWMDGQYSIAEMEDGRKSDIVDGVVQHTLKWG